MIDPTNGYDRICLPPHSSLMILSFTFFLLFIENDYCYLFAYTSFAHIIFFPRFMIRTHTLNFTATGIDCYIYSYAQWMVEYALEREKMTQSFIVSVLKLFIIHCIETCMQSSSPIVVIVRLSSGTFYYLLVRYRKGVKCKKTLKKSTQSQLNLNTENEMHFGSIVAYAITIKQIALFIWSDLFVFP